MNSPEVASTAGYRDLQARLVVGADACSCSMVTMPTPTSDDWQKKGATLSDKTARKEFGLTQEQLVAAIRAGKLHCQQASMHGNPWL